MNLSNLPNPYDFAHPVSEEALFTGRKAELDEIKYYLDQAKTARQPISIAFLGHRASGKTSLLNITKLEAEKRKFCTVRINLDEDDAKSQLLFFYKLFDGLVASVCKLDGFGGIGGKTYDTYLDIVNSYDVPANKIFCPFLFPLQFARAMSRGNIQVPISEPALESDLELISKEIKKPIVLLFDECNVLTQSRVLLEKLRNIFMNMPGFMLVLSGTPDLFPVMDEVFSPIIRQFKKISIGEFKNEGETKECIIKPLESIGIRNPENIFDLETLIDVTEIHNLSGGRPYEIQLICHIMFRRVQEKRATKMKLNLSVLEDVRKELETSQDIANRPIISLVRNLEERQLSALNLLCTCEGQLNFGQIWSLEYIFNGDSNWTKDSITQELEFFLKNNVLLIEGDHIKFLGDEFDRIYTKYLTRELAVARDLVTLNSSVPYAPGLSTASVFFQFDNKLQRSSLRVFWNMRMALYLEKKKDHSLSLLSTYDIDPDFLSISTELLKQDSDENIIDKYPMIFNDLYWFMMRYQSRETAPIFQVKVNLNGLIAQSWLYFEDSDEPASVDLVLSELEPLRTRAFAVGGSLSVDSIDIPIASVDRIIDTIERTNNQELKNLLAIRHVQEMFVEHITMNNTPEAIRHAHLAYKYNTNPPPLINCNLAYIFMLNNDLDKARQLLDAALPTLLSKYNRAILEIKLGNLNRARELLEHCVEQVEKTTKGADGYACLMTPKLKDNVLIFEEIRNPNLLELAHHAINILDLLAQNGY